MTAEDAYDHACTLWGSDAAVWRAGPGLVVVGRWVPLAGAFGAGRDITILKTQRHGVQVLGEGRDWAAAFADAKCRRDLILKGA